MMILPQISHRLFTQAQFLKSWLQSTLDALYAIVVLLTPTTKKRININNHQYKAGEAIILLGFESNNVKNTAIALNMATKTGNIFFPVGLLNFQQGFLQLYPFLFKGVKRRINKFAIISLLPLWKLLQHCDFQILIYRLQCLEFSDFICGFMYKTPKVDFYNFLHLISRSPPPIDIMEPFLMSLELKSFRITRSLYPFFIPSLQIKIAPSPEKKGYQFS